ncbi:GDSL-type esterase/lipase family protein [Lactococcus insecticola]|uniref:Esterase n=1 Tax=Pseudolactococcus insecticola TaxID=2709158 RepID=A0A6A0B4L2_9LACT|nr:GDSL-type esterase/lipase family protein [Lactococcus insecticola]GFH39966.1 esterase [Lactococcus insecticola]
MKIAIFGDSISTSPEMITLTKDFLTRMGFAGAVVETFAVAGEDSSDGLKRLDQVVEANADYNYVFFGANDASDHHNVTQEQFAANLTTFVTALGAAKTSILTTSYVNEKAVASLHETPSRNNANVAAYVAVAKDVAKATGAKIVDLNHAMTVYPGSDEFVGPDGLHFTHEGYELVTSLIAVDVKSRELAKV